MDSPKSNVTAAMKSFGVKRKVHIQIPKLLTLFSENGIKFSSAQIHVSRYRDRRQTW